MSSPHQDQELKNPCKWSGPMLWKQKVPCHPLLHIHCCFSQCSSQSSVSKTMPICFQNQLVGVEDLRFNLKYHISSLSALQISNIYAVIHRSECGSGVWHTFVLDFVVIDVLVIQMTSLQHYFCMQRKFTAHMFAASNNVKDFQSFDHFGQYNR